MTDDKILEIHTMVSVMKERLDQHIAWSEKMSVKRDEQLEAHDRRIDEVEKFSEKIHLLKWPLMVLAVPALGGAGTMIWRAVRELFKRWN